MKTVADCLTSPEKYKGFVINEGSMKGVYGFDSNNYNAFNRLGSPASVSRSFIPSSHSKSSQSLQTKLSEWKDKAVSSYGQNSVDSLVRELLIDTTDKDIKDALSSGLPRPAIADIKDESLFTAILTQLNDLNSQAAIDVLNKLLGGNPSIKQSANGVYELKLKGKKNAIGQTKLVVLSSNVSFKDLLNFSFNMNKYNVTISPQTTSGFTLNVGTFTKDFKSTQELPKPGSNLLDTLKTVDGAESAIADANYDAKKREVVAEFKEVIDYSDFEGLNRILETIGSNQELLADALKSSVGAQSLFEQAVSKCSQGNIETILGKLDQSKQFELLKPNKPGGSNILFRAVQNKDLGVLTAIIQTINNLDGIGSFDLLTAKDPNQVTPLHLAAKYLDSDSMDTILNTLTDQQREDVLRLKDFRGNTPLHFAAKSNNSAAMKAMVKKLEPNKLMPLLLIRNKSIHSDEYGNSPIEWAAQNEHNDPALMQVILDKVISGETSGQTSISPKQTEFLAQVMFLNANGKKATGIAAPAVMEAILTKVKTLSSEDQLSVLTYSDSKGRIPLHAAIDMVGYRDPINESSLFQGNYYPDGEAPSLDVIRAMLEQLSVQQVQQLLLFKSNDELLSPLKYAINKDDSDILGVMLEKLRGNPNALEFMDLLLFKEESSRTPLLFAIQEAGSDVIKQMIEGVSSDDKIKLLQKKYDRMSYLEHVIIGQRTESVNAMLDGLSSEQLNGLFKSNDGRNSNNFRTLLRTNDAEVIKTVLDKLDATIF